MSQINFDTLQTDHPDYAAAWAALRSWFAQNWRKQYVELSVILRALPQVNRRDLVLAIDAMVEAGMLAMAYRVKAPGGYLLEGEYEEPDKIPEELPDRDYSGMVRTAESDIVNGYRWEPAHAS